MTDKEMVLKVAAKVREDNAELSFATDPYPIMGRRFAGKEVDPFHWDSIIKNIGIGAVTFSDEIREKFKSVFAEEMAYVPPVDRSNLCTIRGADPNDIRTIQQKEGNVGQRSDYLILCAEERTKGFVRPVRNAYKHLKCGTVTTMGQALSETYARDPNFYQATYCCHCGAHFPVGENGEFVWDKDWTKVGT